MNHPPLSEEQVSARLVECAACLGYLRDTGRYEVHDQVAPELHLLLAMLIQGNPEALSHVCTVARSHASDWVRYYLAVAVARHEPARAVPLFEDLRRAQGLVAVGAMLALHQLNKGT